MASDTAIEISGVWKIFGDQAEAAMSAVQNEGLGKAEVLERYNAVVGVADVNLKINRGEIFCIIKEFEKCIFTQNRIKAEACTKALNLYICNVV